MKAIGPYVVNREVSPAGGAAAGSASTTLSPQFVSPRTLWVTDRLTGMPALLHELPAPMSVPMPAPELPKSAALLPFSDLVIDGPQIFLVTELPLHAVPASDALLAAHAALLALEALHTHGLAHGGLDSGQLWSIDGRVVLVGGGMHQLDDTFTVARDLSGLAAALDQLGGLPEALLPLRHPAGLSAQQVRHLLSSQERPDAPPTVATGTVLPPLSQEARPGAPEASTLEPAQVLPAQSQQRPSPVVPALRPMSLLDNSAPLPQQGPYLWQTDWTPVEATLSAPAGAVTASPVHVSESVISAQAASSPRTNTLASDPFQLDISEWSFPDFLESPAFTPLATPPPAIVVSAVPTVLQWAKPNRGPAHSESTEVTKEPPESVGLVKIKQAEAAPEPAAKALVASGPLTSASVPEQLAPSAVRRGAKAAATRALSRLRSDAARSQAMAEARRDLLPSQWKAVAEGAPPQLTEQSASEPGPDGAEVGSAQPAPAQAVETPQERRRRAHAAAQAQAKFDAQRAAERRAKPPALLGAETPLTGAPESRLAPAKRQLKPIKATWTAEQTWKVVHRDTAPAGAAQTGFRGLKSGFNAPFWWPLLAALAVAALIGLFAARHKTAPPCCNVEFTLQGQAASGKTARLSLEQAPPEAHLSAGQALGTAPGRVHFPVAGQYQVRVMTDGFTPATVTVTVPAGQPVHIQLGQ